MALNSAVLLAEEIQLLHKENQQRQQKKEQQRRFIATGGSLTVAQGLAKIDKLDRPGQVQGSPERVGQAQGSIEGATQAQSSVDGATQANTGQKRRRAPPKCSICGSLDHNARSCKSK